MSMFMTFIIIGLVWTVSINIITKVEKFGLGQSTTGALVYFNQLETVIPNESFQTISNSVKTRISQYYGETDQPVMDSSIESFTHMKNLEKMKKMALNSGGRTNRMDIKIEGPETVHLLSLKSKSIMKGEWELTSSVLNDKKLFRIYEKNQKAHPVLKPCLKRSFNTRIEAFDSNLQKPILALGGYHDTNKSRSIYYLENWTCEYDEILAGDLNESLERKNLSIKYAEIPIDSTSHILNIAAGEDCIVYTLNDKKATVYFSYPANENGTWDTNAYSYVTNHLKFNQNIGLKFISDFATKESRVLIVDLTAGDFESLMVNFLVGQIVQPDQYEYHLYNGFRDHFQKTDFSRMKDRNFLLIKDLFKINYTQELTSFTPYQLQHFPNTIIIENPEKGMVVIVLFGKYASLLNANLVNGTYELKTLFKIPDQSFVIKAAAISKSGLFCAFLSYSEWVMRIYIVKNVSKDETKVMVANLDYQEYFKSRIVKDLKIVELDDEVFLTLVMDNSEVLTYSMNQLTISSGTLYDLFIGDHLNLISIVFFIAAIGMLFTGRYVTLD